MRNCLQLFGGRYLVEDNTKWWEVLNVHVEKNELDV